MATGDGVFPEVILGECVMQRAGLVQRGVFSCRERIRYGQIRLNVQICLCLCMFVCVLLCAQVQGAEL